jgi:hypothetical protein
MPRAVATWVSPRPVWPKDTRPSAAETRPGEGIPSRPQPSGDDAFAQSRPSAGFGAGRRAWRMRRGRFARPLCDISDPSIGVHAATCPGVAEAGKASIVSPDTRGARAEARKAAWAAPRSELVCGTAVTALEQPQRPVAGAEVDPLVAFRARIPRPGPRRRCRRGGAVDGAGRAERPGHAPHRRPPAPLGAPVPRRPGVGLEPAPGPAVQGGRGLVRQRQPRAGVPPAVRPHAGRLRLGHGVRAVRRCPAPPPPRMPRRPRRPRSRRWRRGRRRARRRPRGPRRRGRRSGGGCRRP